jgi:hypothetical protein
MPVIKICNMPVIFYYGHITDYLKKSFTPQFHKKPLISCCGFFYYFILIKYENFNRYKNLVSIKTNKINSQISVHKNATFWMRYQLNLESPSCKNPSLALTLSHTPKHHSRSTKLWSQSKCKFLTKIAIICA